MATQLKGVLDHFAAAGGPVSLATMAQQLAIDPGVLEGMIAYWVRKGKVREVFAQGGGDCTRCGVAGNCPFVVPMPRTYELVRDDAVLPVIAGCHCRSNQC